MPPSLSTICGADQASSMKSSRGGTADSASMM
jgi:hypothetical protein